MSARTTFARALRLLADQLFVGALYADPAERLPLCDILSTLAHSGERDVTSPVAAYYQSDSPPPSPGANAFDRGSAPSRSGNYDHVMQDGSSSSLPMAARRDHQHGLFGDDEDEEMAPASLAGEGEGDLSLDDLGDDVDFDLGDDCGEFPSLSALTLSMRLTSPRSTEPIFDRPSPSPMQRVWTEELEGDLVEVSHR